MDAETLRQQVLTELERQGFRPARWLPLPDVKANVRPVEEIVSRLMALAAVFTWASAPESAVPTESVRGYVKKNRLSTWMTAEESELLRLARDDAQEQHAGSVGWKLENMWPLAWVLGFEEEPTIEAAQIDDSVSRVILFDFLGGLDAPVNGLVEKAKPRSADAVIAMEDRFYCAHNAVRSAQLGEDTVPEGFHPIMHGGVIHERRHSLTWCLSPGTDWDETDLST
jgi:hypothetical protein